MIGADYAVLRGMGGAGGRDIGVFATVSTGLGAFIPIIPFFFLSGYPAVILAGLISLIAHFLVGAAKTFVTGRSWLASGLEMTIVGIITGVVTYLVGLLIGTPG